MSTLTLRPTEFSSLEEEHFDHNIKSKVLGVPRDRIITAEVPKSVSSLSARSAAGSFSASVLASASLSSSTASTPPPSLASTPRCHHRSTNKAEENAVDHREKQQQQQQPRFPPTSAPRYLSFLINGELALIPKTTSKHTIDLKVCAGCDLHIVCVGAAKPPNVHQQSSDTASNATVAALPVCRICVKEHTPEALLQRTAFLAVGGAVDFVLAPTDGRSGDAAKSISIEISSEPAGSAKNHSEATFLDTAVEELLAAQNGAPSLAALIRDDGSKQEIPATPKWIPPHAEQLLFTSPQINTFLSTSSSSSSGAGHTTEGICCVARKKAKPKYHRRCPSVQTSLGIRGILRRAASGEPAWMQCGTTFSTLMRYFQRSPDVFEWKTDEEKRTVIRHQKQQQKMHAQLR
jgi:hypothetical protein